MLDIIKYDNKNCGDLVFCLLQISGTTGMLLTVLIVTIVWNSELAQEIYDKVEPEPLVD